MAAGAGTGEMPLLLKWMPKVGAAHGRRRAAALILFGHPGSGWAAIHNTDHFARHMGVGSCTGSRVYR